MVVPHDLVLMAKVLGAALAVGLDVLAVSVGVGLMHLVLNLRLWLGFTFAGSEIAMQVIGCELGARARRGCHLRRSGAARNYRLPDDSKFLSASVQTRIRRHTWWRSAHHFVID